MAEAIEIEIGGKKVNFIVELMNADALEIAAKMKDMPKEKQVLAMAKVALVSSDSIDIKPDDPMYFEKIDVMARRLKAEDIVKITEAFMRVNKDFFSGAAAKRIAADQLPAQKTSSAASSGTHQEKQGG